MTQPSKRGIVELTHGPADLIEPPHVPDGMVLRYGLSLPFQVTPGKAALSVNVRRLHVPCIDFEAGTDLVVFDSLDKIDSRSAFTLTRNETAIDAKTGKEIILVKFAMVSAFVPLGARRGDGSPHPHAGTGFAFGSMFKYAADFSQRTPEESQPPWFMDNPAMPIEVMQLAFDGQAFSIVSRERLLPAQVLDGWRIHLRGLCMGLPDSDDMLVPLSACQHEGEPLRTGISRWRREPGGWKTVSFVPVSPEKWMEGTLVRDIDGSLLMCARTAPHDLGDTASFGFGVWQSRDGGQNWQRVIEAAKVRATTPVTMHQALDGTPYITANPWKEACYNVHGEKMGIWSHRQQMLLWPLNESRTGLEEPIVVRDLDKEFGPRSDSGVWYIDHGMDGVVQLADGKWHNLLTYRIRQHKGKKGDVEESTPQTGSYVEEVISSGPSWPAWNF